MNRYSILGPNTRFVLDMSSWNPHVSNEWVPLNGKCPPRTVTTSASATFNDIETCRISKRGIWFPTPVGSKKLLVSVPTTFSRWSEALEKALTSGIGPKRAPIRRHLSLSRSMGACAAPAAPCIIIGEISLVICFFFVPYASECLMGTFAIICFFLLSMVVACICLDHSLKTLLFLPFFCDFFLFGFVD